MGYLSLANANVLSIILYKFYVQHIYIISKRVIYQFNVFVMANNVHKRVYF